MSSKIPEIRVYSPTGRAGNSKENITIFNWQDPKVETTSSFHPFKTDTQPLRFFGSSNIVPSIIHKQSFNPVRTLHTVKWENTFSMRSYNLTNFPSNTTSYRTTYRSQAVAMQRARLGFITGTAKSLDILRQNLQKSINKEIDGIIQKYMDKFFKLGIENIKVNNGENSVTDQHIQTVCRQILEEAKKMYQVSYTRGNSPSSDFLEIEHIVSDTKPGRPFQKSLVRKRKDSDTDSEASLNTYKPKKKKGRPPVHYQGTPSGRSTPLKFKTEQIKREGPKWDPVRITSDTQFIMGAKANKALGLGATRGRLYIKHPEIFKYSGDQEDKQWLYDHNLMPATGGKAYMLLVEDIRELAESEEYRNNPTLMTDEIMGFVIPQTMLQKMRTSMQQMRTDVPIRKRGRPPVINIDSSSEPSIKMEDNTSDGKHGESGAATPTDELDLLSAEMPSSGPSPFSLGTGFEDVSPAQADISPAPSDLSGTLEPPRTAPFDITSTP